MANADCIVLMGGNMAEAHPVGFQWVSEAKARGARIIHIDPRFTRTSAVADKHVPIRAGSDVVLLGGLINHVLTHEKYFREYVVAYTNAPSLITEKFRDTEDLDGLFSGFDPETGAYDPSSWAYEETAGSRVRTTLDPDAHPEAKRDDTLEDPRTVFQILKRHFARYTPRDGPRHVRHQPGRVRLRRRRDHGELRPGAHHLFRVRHRVDAAHAGRAVHPHRRDPAVADGQHGAARRRHHGAARPRQHPGSTDIPTLFNLLPGYLPMPKAGVHDTLHDYLHKVHSKKEKGFWANADAYLVSLLKAWWG